MRIICGKCKKLLKADSPIPQAWCKRCGKLSRKVEEATDAALHRNEGLTTKMVSEKNKDIASHLEFSNRTTSLEETSEILILIQSYIETRQRLPIEVQSRLLDIVLKTDFGEEVRRLFPELKEKLYRDNPNRRFLERTETYQYRTAKKPSLDYYDWHTETSYDWKDHYDDFGKNSGEKSLKHRSKHI